jgi:ribosome maturation factor RimP
MRAQSEIETRILDMIDPEAKALGLDVVRVRVTGAKRPVLQIMAERPDGRMDVEDCAKLSRRLSLMLDEADPIASEYTLEVSSPGIDRPLTRLGDFANWAGHEARVEIAAPVDGRRRFHGFIAGEADGVVTLDLKDGGRADIPVSAMTKARLVLTDALIETARQRGQAPSEEEMDSLEQGFDEIEIDDADEADADAGGEGEEPAARTKGSAE